MKKVLQQLCIILFFLAGIFVTQKSMANCSSCDLNTNSTSISSSFDGEVICITGTPGGNVDYDINHENVTLQVCADNVTFDDLSINQPGAGIEVFGDNVDFGQLNIGNDNFRLYSYASGTSVNGGIQSNGIFDFQALSGGVLSLPNFTADRDGKVIAQDGGTIISQGMTLQNGFVSILINTGGAMTIDNDFTLNNNGELINRDTLTINGDLTYQATGNSLINECGEAVIDINGNFGHDNGPVVNDGAFFMNNYTLNGSTPSMNIEMNDGALFDVGTLNGFDKQHAVTYVGDDANCATFKVGNINTWNGQELTTDTSIYYCGPSTDSHPGDAKVSCDDCSDTRADNYCNPVLPVTFAVVDVQHTSKGNVLNWSTTSENNSDYFIVLRSGTGSGFKEVGRVEAAGNATEELHYAFTDAEACTQCAYRLKQVDYDGQKMYSKVVGLNAGREAEAEVYPNAGNAGEMKLRVTGEQPGSYSVMVYDMMGMLIDKGELSVTSERETFSLSDHLALPSGTCIVVVNLKNGVDRMRVVVY